MAIADMGTKRKLDSLLGVPLLFLLKPLVRTAGVLMRRDHSIQPRGRIVFLKLLGGGSLVLAFPALLGLRRRFPQANLQLVTTRGVEPFARLLGVFDKIAVVEDRSWWSFLLSAVSAWAKAFGADTVADLEVYSRLSTVFSLATCARNRAGFYLNDLFWRKSFNTHLVYFNRFGPVHRFYEGLVRWLGAPPASIAEAREQLSSRLPSTEPRLPSVFRVAVGQGCSGLGFERKLPPALWARALANRLPADRPSEVLFLGAGGDREGAAAVEKEAAPLLPRAVFRNHCGELGLPDSVALIRSSDLFMGIDSALLHLARLLGVESVSFFGPTNPRSLLAPVPGLKEEVRYAAAPCSPCIHVAETPPCRGRNLCMDALFDPGVVDREEPYFTAWAPHGKQ
jgi:ADP-heptose:LPS heptosyltransferase